MRQLHVSSQRTALFHLGTTQRPSFTFQVSAYQPAWTSGIGVYLGYQDPTPAERGKGRYPVIARYQYFLFGQRMGPKGKIGYLARGKATVRAGSKEHHVMEMDAVKSQEVPASLPGERVITLDVSRGKLVRVSIENHRLDDLCDLASNERFSPLEYQGPFGVTCANAGGCVFRQAQFKPHNGL